MSTIIRDLVGSIQESQGQTPKSHGYPNYRITQPINAAVNIPKLTSTHGPFKSLERHPANITKVKIIDPEINKFDGYWLLDSRTTIDYAILSPFIVIDSANGIFSSYPGIPSQVRLPITEYSINELNPINHPTTYVLNNDGKLMIGDTPGTLYTLSSDGDQLYGDLLSTNPYNDGFIQHSVYNRLSEFPPTLVQAIERPNEVDWNRTDLCFKYFVDYLNLANASYVPVSIGNSEYNFQEVYNLAGRYLRGEDIIYKAKIIHVVRSNQVGFVYFKWLAAFKSYPITTLHLDWNPFVDSSIIEICGFKREYASLNGIHKVNPTTVQRIPTTVPDNFIADDQVKYSIDIQVDTSSFPHYDMKCHGCGKIRSINKGLQPYSEYREFITACLDIQRVMGMNVHSGVIVPVLVDIDTGNAQIPDTFEQVRAFVNGGSPNIAGIFTYMHSYNFSTNPRLMYMWPYDNIAYNWSSFNYNNRANIDITKYVGENPFYRVIVPLNYVDPTTLAFLYYKLTDKTFSFQMATPANVSEGYYPIAYRLGGNVFFGPIFGVINNGYVSGSKKIGYLCLSNYKWQDPDGQMLDPAYQIPGDPFGVMRNLVNVMMVYVNSHCDDLIIDQSVNEGGYGIEVHYFGSAFGTARKGFNTLMARTGSAMRDSYNQNQQFDSHPPMNTTSLYDSIDPGMLSPEANFKGSEGHPRNIYLLTSPFAESGGDFIVNYFLGDNNDKVLGSNTFAYIIGGMDGRLTGDAPESYYTGILPINKDAPAIPTPIGPLPWIYFSCDSYITLSHQTNQGEDVISRFNLAMTPDLLLSCSWDIVYRDFGYKQPIIKYRTGIQPDPNNPATWADTWLETTLDFVQIKSYPQ